MVKPYADYEYYSGIYGGSAIAEGDWLYWANRACAKVDFLTFGRTARLESAVLPEDTFAAVQNAVCAVAEIYFRYDTKRAAREVATQHGAMKSESNDGYSVTYAGAEADDDSSLAASADAEAVEMIGEYLAHTGLMFRGRSRRWDAR